MFVTPEGKEIFVVDGHTHFWDGSPENQRNVHGKQFIECFYGYHMALSPPEQRWGRRQVREVQRRRPVSGSVRRRPDDVAIVQSTYLKDFYKNGFNTIERNATVAAKYPDRFIVNGAFDPRDGEQALEYIHFMKETYDIKGVKLYTAEWHGESKGWRLNDPAAYKCFELCEKLGIRNMHVHKGPTIIPLNKDAFDVHDVDHAATDFQGLNWIVEHCGLPRLDFCWIAVQETNVYGWAGSRPAVHPCPAALLRRGDCRSSCSGSALTSSCSAPTMRSGRRAGWSRSSGRSSCRTTSSRSVGVDLTPEVKEKILGLNAARLYDIDVEAKRAQFAQAPSSIAAE